MSNGPHHSSCQQGQGHPGACEVHGGGDMYCQVRRCVNHGGGGASCQLCEDVSIVAVECTMSGVEMYQSWCIISGMEMYLDKYEAVSVRAVDIYHVRFGDVS
eukprot:1158960-Pelagomonas_calceolata.AAC.6